MTAAAIAASSAREMVLVIPMPFSAYKFRPQLSGPKNAS